ncbi:hypothetical protein AMJ40_02560 [candidate division TA06 bacterium DG_26]|uniref:VanZ-like domain-containing protein n=1 Tax=candidate division TA06 bacterium DG_26 TaxID=1703771 RepID=A0A0S7WK44_UNCT6|nr:MAG: hypothetical protein AMJ40_02560 [candidate division TA06 bacterium DG_26]
MRSSEARREIWRDRRLLPILWALLIFAVSSIPGEEIPYVGVEYVDKLAHALEYCILGCLLLLGFRRKRMLVWGVVFGTIDEFHQLLIPGREFSVADLAMNMVGIALGFLLVHVIRYIKERPA